jgi:transcriptional regulator with XRE-family HTH domain
MTRTKPTLLAIYLDQTGISGAAFARRINRSQAYVSMLCAGKKMPGAKTIVAIDRETKGLVGPSSWFPQPDLIAAQ